MHTKRRTLNLQAVEVDNRDLLAEISRLEKAVALLNSMIEGKEDHSDISIKIVNEAFNRIL